MAVEKLEVEIEDGKPKNVPEPFQKLIDQAFGRGQAKAADEAATNAKVEIERLKKAGELSPADKERLKTLEVDLSKAREDLALRDKNFEEAQKIRDKRHEDAIAERETKLTETRAEVEKRTERVRQLVVKELSAVAMAEGARKESLPELEVLLGSRIGLDDGLQAFVRDAKDPGKPALGTDGKAVTIEGFVKQYLTDHPHHKAAPIGRGGGARGGRTGQGGDGPTGEKAQAMDDLAKNPRSDAALANVLRHVGKGA